MNLYFQNSQGKMRVIAKISDDISIEEARAEVAKQIRQFCDQRHFKIYYTRVWNAVVDGIPMTQFDVGSHTEFFFTDQILYHPAKGV